MSSSDVVCARTITVEARLVDDDEFEITARLLDERPNSAPRWYDLLQERTTHDMSLTVRVRYPDLVITHAEARMPTHPYVLCPDALPSIERLVGVSVVRGFTRAVNERLGRQNGCSHLTVLVQAIGPVVKQAVSAAFADPRRAPGADGNVWWVNSCQAWREDGPLANRFRAGDLDGVCALSAHRQQAPDPAGEPVDGDGLPRS